MVIAIILQALWSLGKNAVVSSFRAAIALASVAAYFLKVDNLLILFLGGLLVMLYQNRQRLKASLSSVLTVLLILPGFYSIPWSMNAIQVLPALQAVGEPFNLWRLFLGFLKIGSILYGSGYVLVAFIQDEFVSGLGWLSSQQLIDAIAIGQVTPGPVFSTATFIGYQVGGLPGAALATLGIFLPSFIFVASEQSADPTPAPLPLDWRPTGRCHSGIPGFDGCGYPGAGAGCALWTFRHRHCPALCPAALSLSGQYHLDYPRRRWSGFFGPPSGLGGITLI